jgi:motility quorum-sensing regulator/GCU-specific mRNA interferase toxin
MEKNRPHYPLPALQARIAAAGREAFTQTAIAGGRAMGLTVAEMLSIVTRLSRHDFYKSMTTRNDHRIWQDVYHGVCPSGQRAYIKLTLVAERIVIQFKEK